MKVGLLGGSFNPPHQGHIHISELALKKLGLNQIWWIPTAANPLKEKGIYESYETRVKKCETIIKGHSRIRLKKYDEIYTEKLLSRLQNQYKNIDFIWVMGADNLVTFHKWRNFKKLLKMIPIAVFSREKFLSQVHKSKIFHLKIPGRFLVFHTKNLDISSTQLRSKNV